MVITTPQKRLLYFQLLKVKKAKENKTKINSGLDTTKTYIFSHKHLEAQGWYGARMHVSTVYIFHSYAHLMTEEGLAQLLSSHQHSKRINK